jgi:glycerol-3-phosphate dehydrogenase (NAD(P)+)
MNIGVIGAGSWGTALANLLANKEYQVGLWVFEPEVKAQIEQERENKVFLPGVKLSETIQPTNDMHVAVSGKNLLVMVVPSHVMRLTAQNMAQDLAPETIVVSATKGIENDTFGLMSDVLRTSLPRLSENCFAVLSGPSFASEVARQAPTLITVAAKEPHVAVVIQEVFATPYFRVYTHDDMIGVQLGGAMKNYIALAAGMIDGAGIGVNIRAALITRGLTEMRRIGVKMGANPHTFSGLSGLGDLVLTCTGDLSRNHTVGVKIGQGMKLPDILADMRMVAEGVKTAQAVYHLSRKMDVEMPICESVYQILFENVEPRKALQFLMTRKLKDELESEY